MLEKNCPKCGESIKYSKYVQRYFTCDNCGTDLKIVSKFLQGHLLGGITGVFFLLLLGLLFPVILTSDGVVYAALVIVVYMLMIFPIIFMKIVQR